MRNLLTLKNAPQNAPFQYFVFIERDLTDELVDLYVNDMDRYEKVLEITGSSYDGVSELIEEVGEGNFTNDRVSVLR